MSTTGMMGFRSVAILVLGLVTLMARSTVAQISTLGTLKFNAPTTLSQCEQVQLSWSGQEGPYNLSVVNRFGIPTDTTDLERYLDHILILTTETSYTFTVNYTTGQLYGLVVTTEAAGGGVVLQPYSTIGDGPTWCLSNQSSAVRTTGTLPASPSGNDMWSLLLPPGKATSISGGTALPSFGYTQRVPSPPKPNVVKIIVPVVVVGVLALCFAVWLFWCLRRRRRQRKEERDFAAHRSSSPFQVDGTAPQSWPTPYLLGPTIEEKPASNVQALPVESVPPVKTVQPSSSPTAYRELPETSPQPPLRPIDNSTKSPDDDLRRATRLLELESAEGVHPASSADILRRAQTRCDIESLTPGVIYHAAGQMCNQASPQRITAILAAAQRLVAMHDRPAVSRPEELSPPESLAQPDPHREVPRAQDGGSIVDGQDILPPLYNPEWGSRRGGA